MGQKLVIDNTVGQIYSSTVKYIKPKLGAFIDIGLHSDAFCHISCISDDYVKSVEGVVKVGDTLKNVRILEINREKKRLTVSLRSEEMADNEKGRLASTRQYEEGKNSRRSFAKRGGSSKLGHVRSDAKSDKEVDSVKSSPQAIIPKPPEKAIIPKPPEKAIIPKASESWSAFVPAVQSSDQKTGADLKRERKLQRRADRRAQNEAAAAP